MKLRAASTNYLFPHIYSKKTVETNWRKTLQRVIDIPSALGLPPLPSTSSDTIATLLWAREVLQKHHATTYEVKDPKGIEELKAVKIGGVEQWLHIRGRNRNNPVLLYLHGGPGGSMIGYMDAIQRPWEDYFTVVHWDQRQTGKSYYPADDINAPLTVKQLIADTKEVIQYLRQYLKKDKLFLLGHSWGTVLGMHMVRYHPDWLHAYIGVGQVVNWLENDRVNYKRLLSHARKHNEDELVTKLELTIPYLDAESPDREESYVENCVFVRRELSRLAGETLMHHLFWDDLLKIISLNRAISPHLSLTDLSNAIIGDEIAVFRSPYTFTKDFLNTDLPQELGSSFDLPIFFFTGSHDWHTPVTLSDKWFHQITAPYKELIHFKESSHVVVNEEPGKFLAALVNKVLPFSQEDSEGMEENE